MIPKLQTHDLNAHRVSFSTTAGNAI